jgi:sec-independent protein translocase protein TatA
MFGIGGGEFIFILFIALMLFGSDKIPTIARNLGKIVAQVKNATNDIKSEISNSSDVNGIEKTIRDLKSGFQNQLEDVKTSVNKQIDDAVETIKEEKIVEENSSSTEVTDDVVKKEIVKDEIENATGPIKRQK